MGIKLQQSKNLSLLKANGHDIKFKQTASSGKIPREVYYKRECLPMCGVLESVPQGKGLKRLGTSNVKRAQIQELVKKQQFV